VTVESPSASPNDPLYPQQWNFDAVNLQQVWQQGQFGDPQRRVSTTPAQLSPCGLLHPRHRFILDGDMSRMRRKEQGIGRDLQSELDNLSDYSLTYCRHVGICTRKIARGVAGSGEGLHGGHRHRYHPPRHHRQSVDQSNREGREGCDCCQWLPERH
jgi:hypothetical protein